MKLERFSCYRGNQFGDASDYFVNFAIKKGHEVIEHKTLPETSNTGIFILNVNPFYVYQNAMRITDLIEQIFMFLIINFLKSQNLKI